MGSGTLSDRKLPGCKGNRPTPVVRETRRPVVDGDQLHEGVHRQKAIDRAGGNDCDSRGVPVAAVFGQWRD